MGILQNSLGNAAWLRRFDYEIDSRMSNPFLTNLKLAKAMGISSSHLTRKVKELTGKTPNKYVRDRRLMTAYKYLHEGTYQTVRQTASEVGFINTGYFNRQFVAMYKISPFQILKDNGWR